MMPRISQMQALVMDVAGAKATYRLRSAESKLAFMAAGLMIAAKGTRNAIDARMLIEELLPEFFKEKEGE